VKPLSADAKEYLWEVWDYRNIRKVDPVTASCILENHEEQPHDENGEGEWPLDTEIWFAYADLHGIDRATTFAEFHKSLEQKK